MGMGGVGIALPQGPEAATINPAGASFVESGFEIGTQVFILKTRTTDLFFPGNDVSGHQYQPIPDFGINLHLTDRVTLAVTRSDEHTSELQSLMRNSYAVFCLKKKNTSHHISSLHNSTSI